jgi:hypothetical protein
MNKSKLFVLFLLGTSSCFLGGESYSGSVRPMERDNARTLLARRRITPPLASKQAQVKHPVARSAPPPNPAAIAQAARKAAADQQKAIATAKAKAVAAKVAQQRAIVAAKAKAVAAKIAQQKALATAKAKAVAAKVAQQKAIAAAQAKAKAVAAKAALQKAIAAAQPKAKAVAAKTVTPQAPIKSMQDAAKAVMAAPKAAAPQAPIKSMQDAAKAVMAAPKAAAPQAPIKSMQDAAKAVMAAPKAAAPQAPIKSMQDAAKAVMAAPKAAAPQTPIKSMQDAAKAAAAKAAADKAAADKAAADKAAADKAAAAKAADAQAKAVAAKAAAEAQARAQAAAQQKAAEARAAALKAYIAALEVYRLSPAPKRLQDARHLGYVAKDAAQRMAAFKEEEQALAAYMGDAERALAAMGDAERASPVALDPHIRQYLQGRLKELREDLKKANQKQADIKEEEKAKAAAQKATADKAAADKAAADKAAAVKAAAVKAAADKAAADKVAAVKAAADKAAADKAAATKAAADKAAAVKAAATRAAADKLAADKAAADKVAAEAKAKAKAKAAPPATPKEPKEALQAAKARVAADAHEEAAQAAQAQALKALNPGMEDVIANGWAVYGGRSGLFMGDGHSDDQLTYTLDRPGQAPLVMYKHIMPGYDNQCGYYSLGLTRATAAAKLYERLWDRSANAERYKQMIAEGIRGAVLDRDPEGRAHNAPQEIVDAYDALNQEITLAEQQVPLLKNQLLDVLLEQAQSPDNEVRIEALFESIEQEEQRAGAHRLDAFFTRDEIMLSYLNYELAEGRMLEHANAVDGVGIMDVLAEIQGVNLNIYQSRQADPQQLQLTHTHITPGAARTLNLRTIPGVHYDRLENALHRYVTPDVEFQSPFAQYAEEEVDDGSYNAIAAKLMELKKANGGKAPSYPTLLKSLTAAPNINPQMIQHALIGDEHEVGLNEAYVFPPVISPKGLRLSCLGQAKIDRAIMDKWEQGYASFAVKADGLYGKRAGVGAAEEKLLVINGRNVEKVGEQEDRGVLAHLLDEPKPEEVALYDEMTADVNRLFPGGNPSAITLIEAGKAFFNLRKKLLINAKANVYQLVGTDGKPWQGSKYGTPHALHGEKSDPGGFAYDKVPLNIRLNTIHNAMTKIYKEAKIRGDAQLRTFFIQTMTRTAECMDANSEELIDFGSRQARNSAAKTKKKLYDTVAEGFQDKKNPTRLEVRDYLQKNALNVVTDEGPIDQKDIEEAVNYICVALDIDD